MPSEIAKPSKITKSSKITKPSPLITVSSKQRKKINQFVDRDPYYGTLQMTRLRNVIMKKGRKAKVMRALRELMMAAKQARWDFLPHFLALQPLIKRPFVLRPMRIASNSRSMHLRYMPYPVSLARQYTMSLRLFVKALNERKEFTLSNRLIGEFNDLFVTGRSVTMAKTVEMQKLARESLVNLRYRWSAPQASSALSDNVQMLLEKKKEKRNAASAQRYAKPIDGVIPERPWRTSEYLRRKSSQDDG